MILMKKIFAGVIILVLAFFTKWLLWDLNISSGKLVEQSSILTKKVIF